MLALLAYFADLRLDFLGLALPAEDNDAAIACFREYPSPIISLILELTVFCERPFFSGMTIFSSFWRSWLQHGSQQQMEHPWNQASASFRYCQRQYEPFSR